MPNIMCAQGMWRLVRQSKPPSEAGPRPVQGRLSAWAATTFTDQGKSLVVALEVRTYLTVVFPFGDGPPFDDRFCQALAEALEDLGIEAAVVAAEVSSTGRVCLSRLKDAGPREALEMAQYMCGIERLYHDDLRQVQKNLNEFPHNLPPDYVPAAAVRRLFRGPQVLPA